MYTRDQHLDRSTICVASGVARHRDRNAICGEGTRERSPVLDHILLYEKGHKDAKSAQTI